MNRRRVGRVLAAIVAIAIVLIYPRFTAQPGVAQSPSPSPTPLVSPAPPPLPQVPVDASTRPQPPAMPASTAAPLPTQGVYQDPSGRFRVGLLQGYRVSPLAGTVLIEAMDGSLAYTVVAQAQPTSAPIGVRSDYSETETLAKIATTVFHRGEGFQPGPPRSEAGGGIVMDWTGSLTIGGQSQPVSGVVLVRPSNQSILLMLLAATQRGTAQLPGATAALASSLKAL